MSCRFRHRVAVLAARAAVTRATTGPPAAAACFYLPRRAVAGASPAGRPFVHLPCVGERRATPRDALQHKPTSRRCMSGAAGGGGGDASVSAGMPTDKFFDVSAANFSQLVNDRCGKMTCTLSVLAS